LVDHDRDLRNFLSKAFRAEGYGVPCSDPRGGRAAAKQRPLLGPG